VTCDGRMSHIYTVHKCHRETVYLTKISSPSLINMGMTYRPYGAGGHQRTHSHSPRYVTLDAATAPQRLKMEATTMTTTGLPTASITAPMNADTMNCATNTMLLTCKTATQSHIIHPTKPHIGSGAYLDDQTWRGHWVGHWTYKL